MRNGMRRAEFGVWNDNNRNMRKFCEEEYMAIAIKIRPRLQGCEECFTLFEAGSLIYHSDMDGKDYCQNCMKRKVPAASFETSDAPYTRYLAEGEPGVLVTGRLVLEHSLYARLADGLYGLKEIDRLMVVCSEENGNVTCGNFLYQADKDSYALEKNGKHVLLLFPPGRYLYEDAFVDYREVFDYVWEKMGAYIGGNPVFALDLEGNIVGLSNTRECGLKGSFSPNSYPVMRTLSMKELEKDNKGRVAGKYACKAIERLSPKDMLDYCEKRIWGQGIQLKLAVYQIYRYMQKVAKGDPFCADNWILTAPSGLGKTEFYRTIRELFSIYNIPIPVVQIDLSQITETGYKGSNASSIPQRILAEKHDTNGIAICFLDEADKKCIPSYSSNNVDVNAAVQANLLTLIEGTELKVEVGDEQKDFNSNYTMFVLLGAFQSIRQQKQQRAKSKSLGFTANYDPADNKDAVDQVKDCFYEDLTLQDMIDYGMREELAGRMVQVVNFHKLPEDTMLELIRYKVGKISSDMEIDIEMTEDSMKSFLDISFGSLGVRRPLNRIRELAQNTVAEVFFEGRFDSSRDRVVIDSQDSAHIERRVHRKEYDR